MCGRTSILLISLAAPRVLCCLVFECDPEPASWPERVLKFYESEGDCTGEMDAGQFSIFGAVEEKDGHGFSPIDTDKAAAGYA